jgi:hypothetical protein
VRVPQRCVVSSSYHVSRSMFNSTMFGAINVEASDDRSRAKGLRHTEPMGEGIEPEDVQIGDVNEHSWRAVSG